MADNVVHEVTAPTREAYELLQRTNKTNPDKADVAALRTMLAKVPELWRQAGDLQERAYTVTAETIQGTPFVRESIKAGRVALRRELGYDGATELERLLIDHVVLCWLRQQMMELRYVQTTHDGTRTLKQSEYDERRMTATQGRYLRALETLARVRRLLRMPPVVQVNVGAQQVNMAGMDVRKP